ncbi:putative MINDY deubiquitinase [Helianthus annuus]|nr:putative MINDY deubiquitinase [Helianthus annuus]
MASLSEQQQTNREDLPTVKELMHKTKIIQFFGRDTPIILQNDNGPCPLLAICNVLQLVLLFSRVSDFGEIGCVDKLFVCFF